MQIYHLLKYLSSIKSARVKLLGVWAMYLLRRRYLGVFLDPVMGCNLRCRMCHFSDADYYEREAKGVIPEERFVKIADGLFHRALKLQIGCAAEPTLHRDWVELVRLARERGVPYISLTTNGNALSVEVLRQAVDEGLSELTLSVHGLTQETYEYFMQRGSWEKFVALIQEVYRLKEERPDFRFRINYTVNADNLEDLKRLFLIFDRGMDILQIRPIQPMGETVYHNFDLSSIYERYDEVFPAIAQHCREQGITAILPERAHLVELAKANEDNRLEWATYCYVGPHACWYADYDPETENFERYARRTHLGWRLLGLLFRRVRSERRVSRKLNYRIR